MKTFIILAALVAVCLASAIPMDDGIGKLKTYPRFIEIPGNDGKVHMVDLEAPADEEVLEMERNGANNGYWLYTRSNSRLRQVLTLNNANSVQSSNFDASKPTYFTAHGWLGSGYTDMNPDVRSALLDAADCNVIVTDWSRLAASTYVTAAAGVPGVGRAMGQMVLWLHNQFGMRLDNVQLVGFSLGAHIVGTAGRETGGRVARVTGLDPAGPGWSYNSNSLRPSDAVFVDTIHSDGGATGLGIGSSIANMDFYANGGNSQPGCLTSLCNHNRAYELFASTVVNRHLHGQQCTTNLQITLDSCRGSYAEMGNHLMNKSGSGMYRVNTGRSYPF